MKDRAYQFPTPEHQCCACQGDLSPGGEFYSTICFLEEEFARRNYCVSCWAPEDPGPEEGGEGSGMVDRSGIFAYWRTHRPDVRLMESSLAQYTAANESLTSTLRMDPRMLSSIKRLARSRFLNYQSMIKQWLSERMEQEQRLKQNGKLDE